MHDGFAGATWHQLGAAIDSLDAVVLDLSAAWYLAFHATFWLDLHLRGSVEGFAPPQPFHAG